MAKEEISDSKKLNIIAGMVDENRQILRGITAKQNLAIGASILLGVGWAAFKLKSIVDEAKQKWDGDVDLDF